MPNPNEMPKGNEILSMQNIEAGWVIESSTRQRIVVKEVTRNPQYDIDGVPCMVSGRYDDGVDVQITFGRTPVNLPIADWKKYKVISKGETAK